MDPLTHVLASYTLKRAAFPRVTRSVTLAMLIAGAIADLDQLSVYFGPSAYLAFHRTYFHSLIAAVIFSLLVTLPFLRKKEGAAGKNPKPLAVFKAAIAASAFHLLMDTYQTAGVELFWPFSSHRFAQDAVANLDLWISGILLAGILLPMLSGLITDEIGSKSKGPRGRLGAAMALAAMILYVFVRLVLHGNALSALESRSYRGETPRKIAAFAESSSPFRWHGIVETESALHDVEVEVGPAASFDPDSAITSYKPESSIALDAARDTTTARRFLQAARFPKAAVEKSPQGFHIVLHGFPYTLDASSGLRVQAVIDADPAGKILSQQLTWVPSTRNSSFQ